jgi:hypothetical protein
VAGAVEQQGFEEVDGGGPGVALLGVGGKVAVLEEVAEDFGGGVGEEGGEGSGVPGAREAGASMGPGAYQAEDPSLPWVRRRQSPAAQHSSVIYIEIIQIIEFL